MDSSFRRMNKKEVADVLVVDAAQSTSKLNIENLFVFSQNNKYI